MIGERLGPYRVLNRLGRGGMGEVFQGEADDGQVVAIKVLHGTFDADDPALLRFAREGGVLGDLQHPGIVRGLGGLQVEEGRAWYAMEFVAGRDLSRRLQDEGPLPPAEAVELVAQVLDALAHAHARGVVHRDVKPSNILVDASGRARLVDFGLARALGRSSLTNTGTVLGTPDYMSPEQAQGREAEAPADVWAAGATLHALLSGKPPFVADSPIAVLRLVCDAQPRPLPPGLPPGLEGVVRRALAKDPAGRWPDAAAMAAALRTLPTAGAGVAGVDPWGSTRDLGPAPIPADSTATWSPPVPSATPPVAATASAAPPAAATASTVRTTPVTPGPGLPGSRAPLALLVLVPVVALGAWALRREPPTPPPPGPVAPVASAAPAPVATDAPPRVEVTLKGGVVLAGDLLSLDPAAGVVVVRDAGGRVQRLDLTQVEGISYPP